ncbi:MAG: GPW/gp25 family protein [Actinomycetota bacterium]
MSFVDFPYHLDAQGRTARTDTAEHLHDLIEQVLFTAAGERVNRPTFGTGLQQLVFAPVGDELEAATQFLVQGALQQWLGDRVVIEEVRVEAHEATLTVTVRYTVTRTGERRVDRFGAPARSGMTGPAL